MSVKVDSAKPAAPRVPPRVEWQNARSRGDLDVALSLSEDLIGRNPDDEALRRRTAQMLDALGRTGESLPHWQVLRDTRADDFEAAFHCFRALAATMPVAEAVVQAAPEAGEVFRGALVDALEAPVKPLEGDFRHVAICGLSYCGSTLVDRVLGGLPGVRSIGESHWLTKVRGESSYHDVVMTQPVDEARFVPCTVCGARCEVLTRPFRRSLAADTAHWYRKIARQLDTRILISADKNLPKLVDKDPVLEMSGLVIFKSPEQAWRSQLDKLAADRDADWYAAECRKYLDIWATNYAAYVHQFRPQGAVAFLNFDAFTQNPQPLLKALCGRLGLPFDPEVLHRTVPGHAIGGNGRSMRRLRDQDYGVRIEPLPDPMLDPAHQAMIDAHEGVQTVWREMMALHQELADAT